MDTNNLNEFGNKPRIPGMPIPPNLQAQYLKETFGVTDEQLAEWAKEHQVNEQARLSQTKSDEIDFLKTSYPED